MPRTSTIDIYDQARNGAISEQIHAWRAEGLSVDAVTLRLYDLGIQVTPKTVRRWLAVHPLEQNGGAA